MSKENIHVRTPKMEDFLAKRRETVEQTKFEDLNSEEVRRLSWPSSKSRWGIADKTNGMMMHTSDSEPWIRLKLDRMQVGGAEDELDRWQIVFRM